jgi:hypothetical protein
MNCRKPVDEKNARVFAEVYVCPDCYTLAEHLFDKCSAELKRMLLLLKEAIRVALVEGKLQYGPERPLDDIPKAELLKMIVQLSEKKNEPGTPRPPGS